MLYIMKELKTKDIPVRVLCTVHVMKHDNAKLMLLAQRSPIRHRTSLFCTSLRDTMWLICPWHSDKIPLHHPLIQHSDSWPPEIGGLHLRKDERGRMWTGRAASLFYSQSPLYIPHFDSGHLISWHHLPISITNSAVTAQRCDVGLKQRWLDRLRLWNMSFGGV